MAKNFERIGKGLYRYVPTGALYERVQRDGKNTMFKLPVADKETAEALRGARILQHEQAKTGLFAVQSPYEKHPAPLKEPAMSEVFALYAEAGYPDKKRRPRQGQSLIEEKRRVETLASWQGWKEQPVSAIRPAVLDRYDAWRRKNAKRLGNGRTIDMEIVTLRSALRWAVRQGQLEANPMNLFEVCSYQDTSKVIHCRERRPTDANELHRIAAHFFSDPRSETSGWQLLFEAFTGLRTSEALSCRWDAKPGESGYIDGEVMHIRRAKRGVNPWVKIHPPLAELLRQMRHWHTRRFANPERVAKFGSNPWFFPSSRSHGKPVVKETLIHSLWDYARATDTPPRSSHALRAYYVTVRRSEGVEDSVIAAEIGDKTGAAIISSTYGDLPPNWKSTSLGKLTWLPTEGEPAWSRFEGCTATVIQLPKAA